MKSRIILSTITGTLALIVAATALSADQNPTTKAKNSDKTAVITLTTTPSPAVGGENEFAVTVKNVDGAAVTDAEVSVQLLMPAMPAMSMPEMKSSVPLKAAEGAAVKPGTYTGRGHIPMPGRWNVTVSVKLNGEAFAEKKLTLVAK